MKLVSVKLPEAQVDGLDELVGIGVYPSRSAAIRVAVRDLLKNDLWRAESAFQSLGKHHSPSTVKKLTLGM